MRRLATISCVLAALLSSPALAQDDRQALESARGHMERGQSLYLQGRFEEAALEFQAAFDAQHFAAFLYNEAVALERAGEAGRAADLFEQYLREDPRSSDAHGIRERVTRLREMDRQAHATVTPEHPAPTPPTPTPAPTEVPQDFKSLLSVRTNPAGAHITVRLQGTVVAQGTSPFTHTLDAGEYDVSVEHPDYQTSHQTIHVEPGRMYLVIVELSQGEFLGYLRVQGDPPGAQVFVDDHDHGARGQTPFEAPTPVGHHHIWVERPGYQAFESDVELGVGEDRTVQATLARVEFGRLRVIGNIAGSRVLIDGQVVGEVPYEGQLTAEAHRLRVESGGMKAFEQRIQIMQGQLTPVRVRLLPDVGRSGAWATTILGGLALAGGITTAIMAAVWSGNIDAARHAGTLASDDARLDQGFILSITADVAFGLSLILGCLALYQLVNDPLPPSEGTVLEARDWAFMPWLDPRGAGGLSFGAWL